jgi:hypothetical protein
LLSVAIGAVMAPRPCFNDGFFSSCLKPKGTWLGFQTSFDEFQSASDILAFLASISMLTLLILGLCKAKLLQPSSSHGDVTSLQADKLHELHWLEGWMPLFRRFQASKGLTVRSHF